MFKRALGVVLGLLALAGAGTANSALTKQQERVSRAVMVLYASSPNFYTGNPVTPICTTFVSEKVADGYQLMSEGHCFASAPNGKFYVGELGINEISKLQPVEVVKQAYDVKNFDMLVLHLKTDKQYPVLTLSYQPAQPGERVYYFGYPLMLQKTLLMGIVSSEAIPSEGGPTCGFMCKGRQLVDIGGGPGASGAPIISERTGQVVGLMEGHTYMDGVLMFPAPAVRLWASESK